MDLCLITCNIRFDNPADGDLSWSHRRIFLSSTLLKHAPDIIATQEGRLDQLKDLASLLPDYELIDQHRTYIPMRMYPCLFIKKGKFEVLRSEDKWLSETPDVAGSLSFESMFPRLMTLAELKESSTAKTFIVVNTHLDHIEQKTRIQQAQVLNAQIDLHCAKVCPLIIMGDFNDSPLSPVRDELPILQDAWGMFNSKEETSHHNFMGVMETGERIDWILLSDHFNVESCVMEKSHEGQLYPSDHFPIVCHATL